VRNPQFLFVWNMLAHLVALMSGLVSFGFAIYENWKNKKTESWVFFAISLICLMIACDQAWQDEHRNVEALIAEKSSAVSEREFWKQQSYSKDDSLRTRDTLLGQNYTVLAQNQAALTSLSNRVLDLAKEPLKITPHFLGYIPSQANSNIQAKFNGTFLVLTNNTITPVRLLVTCEAEIVQVGGGVLGTGASMGGGWGGRVTSSKKQYGVGILSPAWTPVNPLLVTIYTNEANLGTCSFDEK
jgi:hypothetical protein